MKAKPKGAKYRNLYARGGVIYYRRKIGHRTIRRSFGTSDWDAAARMRDLYETKKGIGLVPIPVETPRFAEAAARYLAEDTANLAATTRRDRERYLEPDGRILGPLGARRLDEITPAVLREWWNAEIQARGLTIATGRTYLDAIAAVFAYAADLGLIAESPVPAFRQTLRRRTRTKRGRAEGDRAHKIRPIEDPVALDRLVEEARREGLEAAVFVLLLLDAGLRVGEALGLRWGCIAWGDGDADVSRHLLIDRSRPRGGNLEEPKSGRARRVGLSRRLRDALLELYQTRWRPSPDDLVLGNMDDRNFYHREWRRICERAGIGRRALKDLRDTFASQLLTAGVQLGYVSQQLGHADVGTTARHYARWTGGDLYREPLRLEPGEVPADLLARLGWSQSRHSTTTAEGAGFANPRPLQEILEHETGFEPATLTLAT